MLRQEWGFNGLVVSDWMGVYSTVDGINSGVDLEMPGPTLLRAQKLVKAVEDGLVSTSTVDKSALRVLQLAQRLGRFENPDEPPEIEDHNEERAAFIQRAGAQGMVLLKNDDGVLPLPKIASVAIIGHHALHASLGGGGSARVDALRAVSPVEGLQAAGFKTIVAPGAPVYGALPHADPAILFEAGTQTRSKRPVQIEWFNGSVVGENLAFKETKALPEYMIKEKWPEHLSQQYCTRITFGICPTTSGEHVLSIISTGPARCYINGELVYHREQETDLSIESFYFFKSKIERRISRPMKAGIHYTLTLESWNTDPKILNAKPLYGKMFQGSALRFQEYVDVSRRIQEAAEAAEASDYAVVCVGTTSEIESEGFDRDDFKLTPNEYAQVLAVAKANPRTILVNFTGSPVDLSDLVDMVPAIVQAWFPGQECGHSLALALSGEVEPSGRLPFSWPRKDEDNPSWGNFPCDENLVVRYDEGTAVGYRYYDRPENPKPLFPFGFGLSYTKFEVTSVEAVKGTFSGVHDTTSVAVEVRNVGGRPGATVLQIYVSSFAVETHRHSQKRPLKELKDFQRVHLLPGESKTVWVSLDKYAFSVYNTDEACWQVNAGIYRCHVGLSSEDLQQGIDLEVDTTFTWNGL